MGTSVIHNVKICLTKFCSLPDNVVEKIEEKFGHSPYESNIRWTKSSSEVELADAKLKQLENDLEKAQRSQAAKTTLQEKLYLLINTAKEIPSGVKEKFDAKFSSKTVERQDSERSSSSYDAEDYEQSYDIVEVHNHIFVLGGSNDNTGDPLSLVEVYDCFEDKWHSIGPLPIQTTACSAAKITSIPAIVVVGGYAGWRALNTVQKYDFVTKKWEVIEHMRKRRWGSLALGTENGIFVAGGCNQGSVLKSAELYNIKRRQWYTLNPMLTPRCNFSGALFAPDKVIVAGGGSGFYFNSAMDSVELFDGTKGKWSSLPSMSHKRYGCSAVVKNGLFIVLGGCNELGQDIQDVEVFNEKTREWSLMAPLPISSSLCRCLLIDNDLVVFGADGGNDTSHRYDFEEKKWKLFTTLPNLRNGFAVASIGV